MNTFIETLAPFAIKHGTAANVLPSLIVAQGVLESGSGTSSLAKNANNLFGIKKGSWVGETYAVTTGEYTPEGKYYEVVAEFRKYPSYEGAVVDLCEKYAFGLRGESRNRYEAVLGQRDFALAAQAVKDAGYATDPLYPQKLINIYNMYNLSRYDSAIIDVVEDIVEDIIEQIEEETNMAYKIAIDAGHGLGTAGKRTPAGEREWTFNNMVAVAAIAELRTYSNVEILRVDDPSGRTDVPLSTRAAKANAWGADIYISIHHNANTGKWGTWTGSETFVMSGSTASSGSMKLARLVHPQLVKAMGLKDRGIKAANFAVLRETKMPAILTEGGYMDSTIDIVKMRNSTTMRNQGIYIAQGAAAYFGAKKKSGAVDQVSNPSVDPMKKGYLGEGDAGTAVKELQQGLNKLSGVTKSIKITEDGLFGPGTTTALKSFQSYFKLEADGYYGAASQSKMKFELDKLTAKPSSSELYRVRKTWIDAASQLGAFGDLDAAIDVAKKNEGYKVFDGKGSQKYPESVVKPASPTVDNLYRVRKLWSDEASQIGAFADLDGAKELADKNITFNVYDGKGNVAYNPREARDAILAAAKAKAEAEAKAKEEALKAKMELEAKQKAEAEAKAKAEELAKAKAVYKARFEKAVELGITDGSNPTDPATREQVAVMIVRALELDK